MIKKSENTSLKKNYELWQSLYKVWSILTEQLSIITTLLMDNYFLRRTVHILLIKICVYPFKLWDQWNVFFCSCFGSNNSVYSRILCAFFKKDLLSCKKIFCVCVNWRTVLENWPKYMSHCTIWFWEIQNGVKSFLKESAP